MKTVLAKVVTHVAANWIAANPRLDAGVLGVESDTGKMKVGNGTAAWSALSYVGDGVGGGACFGAYYA